MTAWKRFGYPVVRTSSDPASLLARDRLMPESFAPLYGAGVRAPWLSGAAVLIATLNVFLSPSIAPWTASDGLRNWATGS